MSDDNKKFLEKFKSQITTLGKNGILGNDNNKIIHPNINNNKIKKGSAFLKPIKKETNKIGQGNNTLKNNIDNDNNKNNILNYNPNIVNNNQQKTNLLSPSLLYNQYYNNPYMYFNYNYNQYNNNYIPSNGIYPPYQLYYYPQQKQNINPYYTNNNVNISNKPIIENNKIENKNNNKKRLRPISAQNIGRSNISYLGGNNNNNLTNLTLNNKSNLTNINRYEYKPYTLKDYKEIINVDTLGGLGANIGTEEWEKKKEKMDKMSEYAKNIFNKTKTTKNKKNNLNVKKNQEISTRKRASEYSKLIRPKSSGHFNININNTTVKRKKTKIEIISEETKKNTDNEIGRAHV